MPFVVLLSSCRNGTQKQLERMNAMRTEKSITKISFVDTMIRFLIWLVTDTNATKHAQCTYGLRTARLKRLIPRNTTRPADARSKIELVQSIFSYILVDVLSRETSNANRRSKPLLSEKGYKCSLFQAYTRMKLENCTGVGATMVAHAYFLCYPTPERTRMRV